MKAKTLFTTTALVTITTAAFGAASVRVPKTGNNTNSTPQAITSARAGTLRAPTLKTTPVSNATSVATPVKNESTEARMAIAKLFKSSKSKPIKDQEAAKQDLAEINSQIEELQAKLVDAKAEQSTVITESNIDNKITSSVESKTYTKEEIDNLLSSVIKKLPQLDDRGNMTWTDPNGNLVVVHVGDVVIGGDDVIVVDGNLSTTSTHPVQNKIVTNALNEKQDQSTTLSLGAPNGGWTPIAIGSDYIELHTNSSNAKEVRIRPTMIATSLENMENEDQLITAGAVQEAIASLATNPGGGTQQEPYFNLIYLNSRYGELVKYYTYETDASDSEIVDFALNFCGGTFSDKWCSLCEKGNNRFSILKRQAGHSVTNINTQSGFINTEYAVNMPDGISPQAYVNEHLCANISNCAMYYAEYTANISEGGNINCSDLPVHFIQTISSNAQ